MMIYREAENANRKVAAPYDSEIKVTGLVGRIIDAPVENNPACLIPGRMVKQQESHNRFRVDAGNGYNTSNRYE